MQLDRIYAHPVDEKGRLKAPPPPPPEPVTLAEELLAAEAIMRGLGASEGEIEKGLAVVRAAHGEGG